MRIKGIKKKIRIRLQKIGLIKKFNLFGFMKKKFNFLWVGPVKKLIVEKERKPVVIGFVLILIVIGIYFLFFSSLEATAEWWDTNWHYRKAITVSNSGSVQTNFQIKVLDSYDMSTDVTNGKVQADFDDLRFTDINGSSLDYWIEDGTASSLDIWIKVSSVPAGDSTVYMYYGNFDANSIQSGDDTFDFFDDFTGDNLDSSKWIVHNEGDSNGTIDLVNDELIISCISGTTWTDNIGIHSIQNPMSTGYIIESRSKVTSGRHASLISIGDIFPWSSYPHYLQLDAMNGLSIYGRADSQTSTYSYNDGLESGGTGSVSPGDPRTYASYKIEWVSSNLVKFYKDKDLKGSISSDIPNGDLYIYFSNDAWSYINAEVADTTYIDWVFVRKYITTEPVIVIHLEEKSVEPVVCWNFDEGYGTTAQDRTSNNNDGIITGAIWQTEDMCVSGKCLYFDGSGDYVQCSENSIDANIWTISMWFKINESDQYDMLYSGNDNIDIQLFFHSTTKYLTTSVENQERATSFKISDHYNEWHHVTWTHSDSNQTIVYIDGDIVLNTIDTTYVKSGESIYIGSLQGSTYYIDGFIDEVKIYPYARSVAQIKADYVSTKSVRGSSMASTGHVSPGTSSDINISNGLVSYWKMDEGSWNGTVGEIIDSSGNVNNGTSSCLGTCSVPTTEAGKFGNAGSLDGIDDYIDINSSPPPIGPLTLSVWFNTNNIATTQAILGKTRASYTTHGFGLQIGGSKIRGMYSSNNSEWYDNLYANINSNQWHFAVLVFDGGSGATSETGITGKLYLDGELKAEHTGTTQWYDSYDFLIGASHHAGYASTEAEFNGIIDEVRVYNRVLSSREVKALYGWTPGPVGHWKLDENSGTTAYDKSGNGLHGIFIDTPLWQQGKYGSALYFDGNNDRISVSHNLIIEPKSITVGFWAKLQSDGTRHVLVTKWAGFTTEVNSDGTFKWGLNGLTGQYFGTNQINWNEWVYLTGTFNDITKEQCIYIDGIKKECQTPTGSIGYGHSTLYFSWNAEAHGNIDEVKIYNYARTQKQILEDMNASRPAQKSPVGYWKFDEGYGLSVKDDSGHSNDGTITGASWTNYGKFGKALNFNGSSGYVNCGTLNLGTLNKEITISQWVKINNLYNYNGSFVAGVIFPVGSGNKGVKVYFNSVGKMNFIVADGISRDIELFDYTFNENSWYYITLTANIGGYKKLYVNGEFQEQIDISVLSGDLNKNLTPMQIGMSSNPFNGTIDESRIYNYVLTDDEIKQEYNQGKVSVMGIIGGDGSGSTSLAGTAEYCIPGDTVTCNPPIAEWGFDEKIGDYAYDTSGNGNTGTLVNIESVAWKSAGGCKIGACLDFDGGESNEYINCGSASVLDAVFTGITVEAWVNIPNVTPAYPQGIVSKGTTSGKNNFDLNLETNGKVRFWFGSTNLAYTSEILTSSTWHHVVGVWNGTQTMVYLDGVTGETVLNSPTVTASGSPVLIGTWAQSANWWFDGKIDRVRIYNYTRTPAQIAWSYNKGKPIGHWRFDEGEGTTLYDESDNNNDGTLNTGSLGQISAGSAGTPGNTVWYNGREGKQNYSLNFDGDDDYVESINNSGLTGNPDFTLSAWVYIPTGAEKNGTYYPILWWGSGGVNMESVFFGLDATSVNKGFVGFWNGGLQMTGTFTNDVWHHFVWVREGGGAANVGSTLYIDGQSVTLENSGLAGDYSIPDIQVGHYFIQKGEGSRFIESTIDEVKIFNYALTPLQIKTEYNLGAARLGTGE